MKCRPSIILGCALIILFGGARPGSAQQPSPMQVGKVGSGGDVTPSFHGWFKNPDGSFSFLFGYFNRNEKQTLDLPIGPANRFEPGAPDRGQPTHFLANGYHEAMFTVKVPADFGTKKLTWTLVANGKTNPIPGWLNPLYEISPFEGTASVVGNINKGNTPVILWFQEGGPSIQGPRPEGLVAERTATVGAPLSLTVWVADDLAVVSNSGNAPNRAPVIVTWSKYRGTGNATFAKAKPDVEKLDRPEKGMPFTGKATTTVTFDEPGNYTLHVAAEDYGGTGDFGGTNALVRVSVAAKSN